MTTAPSSGPLVLYDGVCGLCNWAVQWTLARERSPELTFAPIVGTTGARYVKIPAGVDPGTIVFVRDGQIFERSAAALQIAGYLKAPWSWLTVLMIIPRPIRDLVYNFVAKNRYRWFGKFDSCPLPKPGQQGRFLD